MHAKPILENTGCMFSWSTLTIFLPTELPTPLKKRRLSPLDACMSESSTPYGSPCATPTRSDQSEAPATPILLATPPRPRTEEPSTEPLPSTPTQTLNAPQEVRLSIRKPHGGCICVYMRIRTGVTESIVGYTEWLFNGKLPRGQPETQCTRGEWRTKQKLANVKVFTLRNLNSGDGVRFWLQFLLLWQPLDVGSSLLS